MKSIIATLLLVSSNVFASTPFDGFLGDYSVLEQSCSDENGCDRTEIRIAYDGSTLRIREAFPQGSIGFPIYEYSHQDDFGFTRVTIVGDHNRAEWHYQQRIRQFAGPELTETDEVRILNKTGDVFHYTYYRREKSPFAREWAASRQYVLKKLPRRP